MASPAPSGVPTAPTAAGGTSSNPIATTVFVAAAVSALVNAAPGALDTLAELAAALGDDPDLAATVTNGLAGKLTIAATFPTWSTLAQRGEISALGRWLCKRPTMSQPPVGASKASCSMAGLSVDTTRRTTETCSEPLACQTRQWHPRASPIYQTLSSRLRKHGAECRPLKQQRRSCRLRATSEITRARCRPNARGVVAS